MARVLSTVAELVTGGLGADNSVIRSDGDTTRFAPLPTVNVVHEGAVGDGVTDDSAAFASALAKLPAAGGTIQMPPGVYLVPNGIVESVPGLRLVAEGRVCQVGPGGASVFSAYGAWIKTTTAGAWCWTHKGSASPSASNIYAGGFTAERIGFIGDGDTAGGLLLSGQNNVHVLECAAIGHTTGVGFRFQNDPDSLATSGWDASWIDVDKCVAFNCLTGFDIGGPYAVSIGGQITNCTTLKNTAGGIGGTGVGYLIRGGNIEVIGGKAERDGIGWHVTATDGVALIAPRAEGCGTGVFLDRGIRLTATSATTSVVTDANAQWAVNQFAGWSLHITAGTGSVASSVITSNTKTALTLTTPMGVAPDATSALRLVPTFGSRHKVVAPIVGSSNTAPIVVSAFNTSDEIIAPATPGTKIADSGVLTAIFGELSNSNKGVQFGDANLYRSAANVLKSDDKIVAALGLGVGNSAAATTLGTVTKKCEVFDASGASLGFVPVYDAIT